MSTASPTATCRTGIDEMLARLRARFLSTYRDQHIEILGYYNALQAGNADDETFGRAVHVLHRIGGTAGTLGLVSLSDAARTAERNLSNLPPAYRGNLALQIALYDFLIVSTEFTNAP